MLSIVHNGHDFVKVFVEVATEGNFFLVYLLISFIFEPRAIGEREFANLSFFFFFLHCPAFI